jgi:hypothetical protein
MRTWGLVIGVAVVVCSAGPAMAENGVLALDDACGDMYRYVRVNDQRVDVPPTDRTATFDLDGVSLASSAAGVRLTFTSCAPVGAPDSLGGVRSFLASLSPTCHLSVTVLDDLNPSAPRHATFSKTCYREDTTIFRGTPLGSDADLRFSIELPASALKVSGTTMTVDLDRSGLTGEAAQAVAPGAVWQSPSFSTAESVTAGGNGFVGGDAGLNFGWRGPGGFDSAGTQNPYTVD